MTRVLAGYDGSPAARAALHTAAALFPGAQTTVVTVHAPPSAHLVELLGLPDEGADRARELVGEGAVRADAAGLHARRLVLTGTNASRALLHAAQGADVIVCGTRGEGPLKRGLLGSTAAGLLHHADRPLLVVPESRSALDGPVLAGFDDSDGARDALRFAARHLSGRRLLVAHAWDSPIRHSARGRAMLASKVELFADYAAGVDEVWREVAEDTAAVGAAYARDLGLNADAVAPENDHDGWRALLQGANDTGAAAILVGTRGRGSVASTVLGSVASGLVHAAAVPVLIVPRAPERR